MEHPQVLDSEKKGHSLLERFFEVRTRTEELCAPLETEDFVIQSMDDVSPPKWHLGHTSWFFETFLLGRYITDYKPYQKLYGFLFNSYYETIGDRWLRTNRGLLSRPTVKEVYRYRAYINDRMHELIWQFDESRWPQFHFLVELGLHHEQQHQELLLTDIKHILSINPLKPRYADASPPEGSEVASRFIEIEGGVYEIGYSGSDFSFDNEKPRHHVWLDDYKLQNRLVTNREYLQFIEDRGYSDFHHWLSDGWAKVQELGWKNPMYWENLDGKWHQFTLNGLQPIDWNQPLCHVSYYEADAYARWAGMRLPTEAEWERVAEPLIAQIAESNFVETRNYHPVAAAADTGGFLQMFGDVWEWNCSSYLPYPGFRPEEGAVGEYNGKFMSDQMILRGGSCATPVSHIRSTYRNFFQCDKRWQFSGIRLAE